MSAPSFQPPRCPNRACPMHRAPQPRFFQCCGSYRARCRADAVPRFRCKHCRRGFSRQTFRQDYRDRRPECNGLLFRLLVSGVGLRQAGRWLRLGVHAVQHKFRKLAHAMRRLDRNLLQELPPGRRYLLDELETFEHSSILPLSVPVLIEHDSLAVVAAGVAPIRRVARIGSRRQRWLSRHEQSHGRRKDRSVRSLRRILGRLRRRLRGHRAVLVSDRKQVYASLCRGLLRGQVEHERVSGELPRTTYNPLFRINLTDAMLRDNNGRLRRRSWLVSKTAACLRRQLALFTAYRNWHRLRTNREQDELTPGVQLGCVHRRLSVEELLAWRQDWGRRSIHPTSVTGSESIAAMAA